MSRREIMATSLWEMRDMIALLDVYNGNARLKKRKKSWSFDEAIALR